MSIADIIKGKPADPAEDNKPPADPVQAPPRFPEPRPPQEPKAPAIDVRIGARGMSYVTRELLEKGRLYEEKTAMYGDTYHRLGAIMALIWNGTVPQTSDAQDNNRSVILAQMVIKIMRYAENWNRGGHADSLDDLAVYAMMLKDVDRNTP